MKIFFNKIDWISPPITLFFKNEKSHKSFCSGFLSIITYILVFFSIYYYAKKFINKETPKSYFFTRFVDDAGTFPVNATQMFHFIQVSNPDTNEKVPLDFAAFRIVGFDDAYSDNYMDDPGIVNTKNHWVYGKCNNNSDTKGISYLIDQKNYEESACIRKYYDATKRRYFETNEEGFRWPVILKGCSNPERTYYGIIMQRCDMADPFLKEQGPTCKSASEIDVVVNSVSFNFQIIDHFADMLNYEMPFTKYFYEVTSAITSNNFIIQHLNFNPANMITHNGFFFDNQVREEAYFFTQNEKQTIIESDVQKQGRTTNGCLIGVYYWMQNTLQYYERNYDKFQDVLSDIGGFCYIVLAVFGELNLLIHNYIVALDTEELVFKLEQNNNFNREINRRPTTLKNSNDIVYPFGRSNFDKDLPPYEELQKPSNFQKITNDGIDPNAANTYNVQSKEDMTEQYKNLYLRNNRNIHTNNIFNSNYEGSQDSQIDFKRYRRNQKNRNRGGTFHRAGSFDNKDDFSGNIKEVISAVKKEQLGDKPLEKRTFNWFNYIGYLICLLRIEKKDNNIYYYENFRAKIISEENIFQNYMDINRLLKACNIKKTESINNDKVG